MWTPSEPPSEDQPCINTISTDLLTDPHASQALPTKEGTYIGVVLFRPDNPLIAAIKTKEDAKAFFAQYYPQFVEILQEEHLEVGT